MEIYDQPAKQNTKPRMASNNMNLKAWSRCNICLLTNYLSYKQSCVPHFCHNTHIKSFHVNNGVRKSDEDVEDLDEDVYCCIAVTKYMLYLGFNGVRMKPSKPFFYFQFTTHVNEVAPVVTAVVCMLIKFWHPFVWGGSQCPTPAPILQLSSFAQDVIIPNGPQTT